MKFELTLKFNKNSVRKEAVEAKSRADLDEKIKLMPFWYRNKDRITIDRMGP